MEQLLKYLFRHSSGKPQLGFAGQDKRAWLWLPGQSELKKNMKYIIEKAPLRGCTQVSYDDWFEKASGQDCEVCWFGLDIDQEDNLVDLIKWSKDFSVRHKVSMIRSSCSGKGIHMIWVLAKPVYCSHEQSSKIVKQLAEKKKELVEAEGIHVCQANKRMFWLVGGKNASVYISNFEESSTSVLKMPELEKQQYPVNFKITAGVEKFVSMFQSHGLLNNPAEHNKVYVGDVVNALRGFGETVYTKSSCSGNGQTNGYIDIQGHTISLWSYADGHTIWNYTDLEGLL